MGSADVPADLERAQHLLDLRRPAEAERVLGQVLAGDPQSGAALRLLTMALHQQDRDREALTAVERAIATEPDEEHGHRLHSILLAALDRPADAVGAAREAVRLEPYLWMTHYTLGMALRLGRRPQSAAALECANQALRLAPHASEAHNLAGLCLDDLKRPVEARQAYAEALRLDPDNTMALNNLAADTLDRGKLGAAGRLLTSALSSDPQQRLLHHNYDAILLKLVRRLYFALLVLGVLLAVLAGVDAPYSSRVATVVVLLGVYAAATWRVTRNLPRGAHLVARGLFRRSSGFERLLLAAFVLLSVTVLAMGLAPRDTALVVGALMLVLLRTVGIVLIVGWVLKAARSLFKRE